MSDNGFGTGACDLCIGYRLGFIYRVQGLRFQLHRVRLGGLGARGIDSSLTNLHLGRRTSDGTSRVER